MVEEGEEVQSEISSDKKRLLRIRRDQMKKRPVFRRQESWRLKRVKASWRRPRGIDSKMRLKVQGWPKSVEVGYRSPKKVRGLHPSGLEEVLVHNLQELERVESGQAVRIGRTVGLKKRLLIIDRAREMGLRILNPGGLIEFEPEESEETSI